MTTPDTREVEACLPTEEDLQKVGDHYWGGDYEPQYQELIHLKQSFKEILTPKIEKYFHQELQKARQDIHTSLVEAVEGLREDFGAMIGETERKTIRRINRKLDDTLNIINSIFKE